MSDCDASRMEELMMQPDERERDKYGNTEDDFQNCSFPDCGCDGARLCMAPNGAHEGALILNLEKMPYELRCRLNQEKEPTK